jgi:hypothetical protein
MSAGSVANPNIQYHRLTPDDPRVIERAVTWVQDPVVFSIEAGRFVPYWYQEPILNDPNDQVAVLMSRQLGKSQIIAGKAIHKVFTSADSTCLIVSPSLRQSKLLYRKMTSLLRNSPLLLQSVENGVRGIKMEETMFNNGSLLVNVPATSETVRGYTVDLLIVEEAAYVADDMYDAVEEMLVSTYGQEILLSTPRGKHNRFYQAFHPPDNEPTPYSTHGPYIWKVGLDVINPRTGRPQINKKWVMKRKRFMHPINFRQEYLAEFVEDVDNYFPMAIINAMFNPNMYWQRDPQPGHYYFMGIDLARKHDSTVIWINELVARDHEGKILTREPHVKAVHITEIKNRDFQTQLGIMKKLCLHWKPTKIYFDKTALGEMPFEEMKMMGFPIEGISFTMQKKSAMFGNLYNLAAGTSKITNWQSRFQIPMAGDVSRKALKQFENLVYEIPETKSQITGNIIHGSTLKIHASTGHDDFPVAAALSAMCSEVRAVTAQSGTIPKNVSGGYRQSIQGNYGKPKSPRISRYARGRQRRKIGDYLN